MDMTDKTYTGRHVPFLLVREWADKDAMVKTITRDAEKFEERKAVELFSSESGADADDNVMLSDVVFPDVLESLKKEDADGSPLTMAAAVLLVLELFNVDYIEYYKRLYPFLSDVRKDLLELDFPYLLDLMYCILETPSWMNFVLGDHPLYIDNMLRREEEKCRDSLYRAGFISILPLTPKRALLLFDSSSYWLHGKDETVSLESEDVSRINRYIMKKSRRTAVFHDEDEGHSLCSSPDYYKEYYDDEWHVSFPFSFLSVRPGAEERAGSIRPLSEYLKTKELWRNFTRIPQAPETLRERVSRAVDRLKEER